MVNGGGASSVMFRSNKAHVLNKTLKARTETSTEMFSMPHPAGLIPAFLRSQKKIPNILPGNLMKLTYTCTHGHPKPGWKHEKISAGKTGDGVTDKSEERKPGRPRLLTGLPSAVAGRTDQNRPPWSWIWACGRGRATSFAVTGAGWGGRDPWRFGEARHRQRPGGGRGRREIGVPFLGGRSPTASSSLLPAGGD